MTLPLVPPRPDSISCVWLDVGFSEGLTFMLAVCVMACVLSEVSCCVQRFSGSLSEQADNGSFRRETKTDEAARHSRWRTQPEEFLQGAQLYHQCVKQQITSSFSPSPPLCRLFCSFSLRPCPAAFPEIQNRAASHSQINSLASVAAFFHLI